MFVSLELHENYHAEFFDVYQLIKDRQIEKANLEKDTTIQTADFPFVVTWSRFSSYSSDSLPSLEDRIKNRPKCFSVINQ
jgi:hypothetical protein